MYFLVSGEVSRVFRANYGYAFTFTVLNTTFANVHHVDVSKNNFMADLTKVL